MYKHLNHLIDENGVKIYVSVTVLAFLQNAFLTDIRGGAKK